jgi:N utilization substance protein A
MTRELVSLVEHICRSREISPERVFEIVKEAILFACRKKFKKEKIEVELSPQSGEIKLWRYQKGEEAELAERKEISLEDLGRIEAHLVKNIINRELEKEERTSVYQLYRTKIGDCISATVQKVEKEGIILSVGKTSALLPPEEQIPQLKLRPGDQLKVYVLEVKKTGSGPPLIVSQTHPEMIRRLFELEVPEVSERIIKIVSVARMPGIRTKVAIHSTKPEIDAVGTCIGLKGVRIQAIVKELRGEKLDLVIWDENPEIFLKNALSPGQISSVIEEEKRKTYTVVVPDDQISLTIGKGGQNVKLAARLTGWRINIKRESVWQEELEKNSLKNLTSVGEKTVNLLTEAGINSLKKLAELSVEELQRIPGIGEKKAERIHFEVGEILGRQEKK